MISTDIKFVKTDDGVTIAYWSVGSGSPILMMNNWSLAHAELEWGVPSIAKFYDALAERHTLIRYDPRGTGMSGPPPGGWGQTDGEGAQLGLSQAEMVSDVESVVDSLGLDSFTLMANSSIVPIALGYAADHIDRLSALVLFDGIAAVRDSYVDAFVSTNRRLEGIEADTGNIVFNLWERLAPEDEVDQLLALVRDPTWRAAPRHSATLAQMHWDASDLLARIDVPVLVVASRDDSVDTLGDSRDIAAGLPHAQIRVVDGTIAPYFADQQKILVALFEFLGSEAATGSGFRTIVFTDIVDSTKYIDEFGDEVGRAAVRDIENGVLELAKSHGGAVVKNLGDGSLVSFPSNTAALAFGLALQSDHPDRLLKMRVGVAAGEPIHEDGDVHGAVVAQASRIADLAEPGEVLVADSVRQLALGKGFDFTPRGEVSLKGFEHPTAVFLAQNAAREK